MTESLFIILMLALNGYFVAAEFALVRLHSATTHKYQEGGQLTARIVRRMLHDIDAYLSTAQLGITFTSITLGSFGEPFVSHALEKILGTWVPAIAALGHGVSIGLSLALITVVQIIVGEQGPKSYGIRAYERVVGATAIPMQLMYWIFFPIIWIIGLGSMSIVRLLGGSADGLASELSEEELRILLLQGRSMGSISESERQIMTNAMRLEELEAREVMVPRPDIVTIEADATADEARALVVESGHSRIPIVDPDLDHCVGFLYAKDLLQQKVAESTPVSNLVREAVYVPETINAEKLLYMFQTRGLHIAIAVDEFGGASGIVSLEDILEELVGEIQDEYDDSQPALIRSLTESRWRASGMTNLEDVGFELEIEFDTDQDTLSGWFTDHKNDFPRRGDQIEHRGYSFTVESMERHRIASLLIERLPENEDVEEVNI